MNAIAPRLDPNHADDTGILDCLMPVITAPIGYECVTDYPEPNLTTQIGLVWDQTYRCFFLDVTEKKIGRRVDEIAEVSLSRDGLRQMRALIDRALGDRT